MPQPAREADQRRLRRGAQAPASSLAPSQAAGLPGRGRGAAGDRPATCGPSTSVHSPCWRTGIMAQHGWQSGARR
jgi:hypothetical protein